MVEKRILEHTIDLLIENNIDTFFLVTGGAIVPTIDYIGQHPKALNLSSFKAYLTS